LRCYSSAWTLRPSVPSRCANTSGLPVRCQGLLSGGVHGARCVKTLSRRRWCDRVWQEHRAEVEALEAAHAERLAQVERAFAEEAAAMKQAHLHALQQLDGAHVAAVVTLQEQHAEGAATASATAEDVLQEVRGRFETTVLDHRDHAGHPRGTAVSVRAAATRAGARHAAGQRGGPGKGMAWRCAVCESAVGELSITVSVRRWSCLLTV